MIRVGAGERTEEIAELLLALPAVVKTRIVGPHGELIADRTTLASTLPKFLFHLASPREITGKTLGQPLGRLQRAPGRMQASVMQTGFIGKTCDVGGCPAALFGHSLRTGGGLMLAQTDVSSEISSRLLSGSKPTLGTDYY
jgi:hypothetical protein